MLLAIQGKSHQIVLILYRHNTHLSVMLAFSFYHSRNYIIEEQLKGSREEECLVFILKRKTQEG